MKTYIRFTLLLLLATLIVLPGCKKDNDDDTGFDSNARCHFIGTIGGVDIVLKEVAPSTFDSYGCFVGSGKNIVPSPDTSLASYDCGLFHLTNDDGINISLGTARTTEHDWEQPFYDLFAVKSYPYTQRARDGVTVSYLDANGDFWTTDEGSQTGSTFQFTSVSQGYDELFGITPEVKFEAIFNCTLYKDDGSGDSMELTGGSMKGMFQED